MPPALGWLNEQNYFKKLFRTGPVTTFLVTGGCGFIGSNFIRHILGRWGDASVVNLDLLTYAGRRDNLADVEAAFGGTRYFFVQGDICDGPLVESLFDGPYPQRNPGEPRMTPDFVVNFAAETHVDRSIDHSAAFIRTNILGTHTLLESARHHWAADIPPNPGQRRLFVQISTDEVYGCLGEEGYFTEDSPLAANSPYAASKASADLLVRSYHRTYGLPVVITRSSNNYGPYQFPEKLIPLMITSALADRQLPVYGDGRNVREWLHVEDHCEAIECVLQHGADGGVYNVGGGDERRNLEVVESILRLLNKPRSLIRFVEDRLGHDWRYALNCTRLYDLGWRPKYKFEQGLEQTLAWYVRNAEQAEPSRPGADSALLSS
jgi:dTDP-glucose 4,6-dehydratase